MNIIKRYLYFVAAGVLAASLTSCGSSDETTKPVINLTSSEIATLLGINEADGIKIGAIASDRDGVKVESIAFEDGKGRELEIQDVELKIVSSSDMVYSVSYLGIKRLELQDLKNSQRTKAKGITVIEPGKGFLVQIASAIASAKTGGTLKTSGLSFAKLTIDQIDYLIRTNDTNVTKITVDSIYIDKATKETVDDMRIGRISMGDTAAVSVENLRFRVVDRIWADKILAILVRLPQADTIKWDDEAMDLGDRIVPFDQFGVDKMTIRIKDGNEMIVGYVTGLNFDVKRNSNNEFEGLEGKVNGEVPLTSFPDEFTNVIRAMGNKKIQDSLTCSVTLKLTHDQSGDIDKFENISITVPEMFVVTGGASTRGLVVFGGKLFGLQFNDKLNKFFEAIAISSFNITYQDYGLLPFLLSRRFKDRDDFRKAFTEFPSKFEQGAESDRLIPEVDRFLAAPYRINFTARTDKFVPFDKFFGSFDRPRSSDARKETPIDLQVRFISK
jgi:hypothetical protein